MLLKNIDPLTQPKLHEDNFMSSDKPWWTSIKIFLIKDTWYLCGKNMQLPVVLVCKNVSPYTKEEMIVV